MRRGRRGSREVSQSRARQAHGDLSVQLFRNLAGVTRASMPCPLQMPLALSNSLGDSL